MAAGIKGKGGHFLKVNQGAVHLNEDAIRKDAQFDGVWTSLESETPSQVYAHYGELWQIEEGFLVLKHTRAIRPIFHWTARRVKAHVAICFAAFAPVAVPVQHAARRGTSTERGTDTGRAQQRQDVGAPGSQDERVLCVAGGGNAHTAPALQGGGPDAATDDRPTEARQRL